MNKSQQRIFDNALRDIQEYADEYFIDMVSSLGDWLNESPCDEWLQDALESHIYGPNIDEGHYPAN